MTRIFKTGWPDLFTQFGKQLYNLNTSKGIKCVKMCKPITF